MEDYITFNQYQTQLTEDVLNKYPKEVIDEFYEYLNTVPFIQRLVSMQRKYACDLMRDEEDKIIVDISNPHILENMDYFRQTAIHFQKHGCYTKIKLNYHPHSAWMTWFKEECRKCWEGMVRPEDGEWITGDMYYFLNYSLMSQTVTTINPKTKRKIVQRKEDLPEVWEGIYLRYHYLHQAQYGGIYNNWMGQLHGAEIASRGKGKSYTMASLLAKCFSIGTSKDTSENRKALIVADNKEFLIKDGTLNKFEDMVTFMAKHTQFPTTKIKDSLTTMNWISGWIDSNGMDRGPQNEVLGVPIGDNASKSRGKRPHPLDCKVITPNGIKLWGDINIGDYLFGDDGKPTKVIDIPFQGIEDVYKITLKDGRVTYAGKEHLWKINNRVGFGYKQKRIDEIVTTEEILYKLEHNTNKNIIVIPKGECVEFKEQSLLIDPYVMGLYLGDGCFKNCVSDCINLTMLRTDIDNIEKYIPYTIEKSVSRDISHKIHLLDGIKGNFNYPMYSKNILDYYGLKNKKSVYKIIPDVYLFNTQENRLKLLKGLLDSDGSCTTQGTVEYATKSEKLKDQVMFLCRSLGINCSMYLKYYKRLDNIYFRIKLHVKNKELFNLKRKQDRIKIEHTAYGNSFSEKTSIVNVEYIGKKECKCVTVDNNSHLYMIDDFIVTHNSSIMIAEEFGSFGKFSDWWSTSMPNVQEGAEVFGVAYCVGCVCEGTKVYDKNGYITKIENINKETGILGYDGTGSSIEEVSYIQDENYKECVEIECENNIKLRCSIDHPILSSKQKYYSKLHNYKKIEFKKANKLVIGDHVMLLNKLNIEGTKTLKDAELIGLLIGDGNYSSINSVSTLSVLGNDLYNYLDDNYKFRISKIKKTKNKNIYAQIYFKRSLLKYLKKLGIFGQTCMEKTLPKNINSYNLKSISKLLKGLFEADGDVRINKGTINIRLTSKNISLLEEVKVQLLRLGINSTIRMETKGNSILYSFCNNTMSVMNPYECGVLYITNQYYVNLFKNKIGFISSYKNRILNKIKKDKTQSIYNDCRFIIGKNFRGHIVSDKVNTNLEAVRIKKITNIGIQRIYNITANNTHTYLCENIVTHNTGGEDGNDFSGALDMIQSPESNHIYGVPNIYDKGSNGSRRTIFFFPAYINYKPFYNKDGVSDVVGAMLHELNERYNIKYNSIDPLKITKRKAEFAFTIQDAIMRKDSTIYPVADLNDRINQIDSVSSSLDDMIYGDLSISNSKVSFKPNSDKKPILHFPHKENKLEGAVHIKTLPIRDSKGEIPWGRYIAGADPYDDDISGTLSLGSIFILDLWTDDIVAEYTGRGMFAEDYYEICRRLCLFYNAELNYENNKKGLFAYFSKYNSLYLLCDTLEFLKDKDESKISYSSNKTKGTANYANSKAGGVAAYGRRCIRDYLLKPYLYVESEVKGEEVVEVEKTISNLHRIKFRALLCELAMWNPDGNFDRHDALVMLMLLREDKLRLNGDDSFNNRKKDINSDYLGNDSYFASNYGTSKEELWKKQLQKIGLISTEDNKTDTLKIQKNNKWYEDS